MTRLRLGRLVVRLTDILLQQVCAAAASRFPQPPEMAHRTLEIEKPSFGKPSFGKPCFGKPSFGKPSFE